MVELFVQGGSEDDDRVGQRLVVPEPVNDRVMVVEAVLGPATVLEFDQKTELNDETLEPPVPVTVMVIGVPALEKVENVVTVGEELVMSVSLVDEEPLVRVGMTVADETQELPDVIVEAEPEVRALSVNEDTEVKETRDEVTEELVK